MKTKLIAVRTPDFDIKMLRKAAREGRLFIIDENENIDVSVRADISARSN